MASLNIWGGISILLSLVAAGACTADLRKDASDGPAGQGPGSQPGGDGDGDIVAQPSSFSLPVMRRLNRMEYNNTVRDLLHTDLTPADTFPTDDLGGGFPTVGAALSISPAYVLSYEAAAHALIDDLFASEARLAQFVPCDVEAEGQTCARQVLGDFATKAWRRPVSEEEVTTLLHPLNVAQTAGATQLDGLRHAMAAVLLSPHFIFKVEASQGELDGFELATRLSYSLWGTMPDDALLAAAESGELVTDEGLEAQVQRMLDDPSADALVENFAARWLDYDNLEHHEVNAELFPEFTYELAESMKKEANLFIKDLMFSDVPVPQMLVSSHTYVDEALSAHYGIAEPRPADTAPGSFWRVDGAPAHRGGLLTLGALLTHTSLTSRTSPVKRGDFVFKHMLCGEIPPPPAGVEGLPDSAAVEGETLRERLERHVADPQCANCHATMDPIGYGLEHFDAIGRYRTDEGGGEVDASGILPLDGEEFSFNGAQELAHILSDDSDFSACVTKHFMTYALGVVLGKGDDANWARFLTQEADADGGSFKSMITQVVMSQPFRHRMM